MANTCAVTLPALTSSGYQAALLSMSSSVTVSTPITGGAVVYVVMDSAVVATIALTTEILKSAEVISSVGVATSTTVQMDLFALMTTLVNVGFVIPIPQNNTSVWVVDQDTKSVSRYDNFGFNSYGFFDGAYIAAKEDGLYVLDGTDDAGTDIQTTVDFGRLNFGTSALKHVTNAYVGVAADDTLYLKVTVEGGEYIYSARSYDENKQVQRFDLGRGLRSNYFDFTLHGNGAALDLSSVEFLAIPLTRRI